MEEFVAMAEEMETILPVVVAAYSRERPPEFTS